MDTNLTEICTRMKSIRKMNGLTQAEVAQALNLERTAYTKYETGRVPSLETLFRFASLFNISPIELIIGDSENFFARIHSENPNEASNNMYLLPSEKQLVLRFRLCSDEDKRKVMDEIIDLALKNQK